MQKTLKWITAISLTLGLSSILVAIACPLVGIQEAGLYFAQGAAALSIPGILIVLGVILFPYAFIFKSSTWYQKIRVALAYLIFLAIALASVNFLFLIILKNSPWDDLYSLRFYQHPLPYIILIFIYSSSSLLLLWRAARLRILKVNEPGEHIRIGLYATIHIGLLYFAVAGLRYLLADGDKILPADFLMPYLAIILANFIALIYVFVYKSKSFPFFKILSFIINIFVSVNFLLLQLYLSDLEQNNYGIIGTEMQRGILLLMAPFISMLWPLFRWERKPGYDVLAIAQVCLLSLGIFWIALAVQFFPLFHYTSFLACVVSGIFGYQAWLWSRNAKKKGGRFYLALSLHASAVLILFLLEITYGYFTDSMGITASTCYHLALILLGAWLALLVHQGGLSNLHYRNWQKKPLLPVLLALVIVSSLTGSLCSGRTHSISFESIDHIKPGMQGVEVARLMGLSAEENLSELMLNNNDDNRMYLSYYSNCSSNGNRVSVISLKLSDAINYPYGNYQNSNRLSLMDHHLNTTNIEPTDILELKQHISKTPMAMYSGFNQANLLADGQASFFKAMPDGSTRVLTFIYENKNDHANLVEVMLRHYETKTCAHINLKSNMQVNRIYEKDFLPYIAWIDPLELTVASRQVVLRSEPSKKASTVLRLDRGMVLSSNARYSKPGQSKVWYYAGAGWADQNDFVQGDLDLPDKVFASVGMENFLNTLSDSIVQNERSCRNSDRPYEPRIGSKLWKMQSRRVVDKASIIGAVDASSFKIDYYLINHSSDVDKSGIEQFEIGNQSNSIVHLKIFKESFPNTFKVLGLILPFLIDSTAMQNLQHIKLRIHGYYKYEYECSMIYNAMEAFPISRIQYGFKLEKVSFDTDNIAIDSDGRLRYKDSTSTLNFDHSGASKYCESLDSTLPDAVQLHSILSKWVDKDRQNGFWLLENQVAYWPDLLTEDQKISMTDDDSGLYVTQGSDIKSSQTICIKYGTVFFQF